MLDVEVEEKLCDSCEYNEDEFCLAELEDCECLLFKKNKCSNYLNKNITWHDCYENDFCKRKEKY
jgi:hypothetical protein